VVEKAINQNKIESFMGKDLEIRGIAYLKAPAITASGIAYISLVQVDAQVVGVREIGRVGPWAASDV
jgi:hypothetical protein